MSYVLTSYVGVHKAIPHQFNLLKILIKLNFPAVLLILFYTLLFFLLILLWKNFHSRLFEGLLIGNTFFQ